MPIAGRHLRPGRWSVNAGVHKILGHFTPAYARWVGPEGDHARYHDQTLLCVSVFDGDTVSVARPDGSRRTTAVRLLGIDAPEVRHAGPGPQHWAAEATAALRALLLNRWVRLALPATGTRCKYRRLLAYLYAPGHLVSANARLLIGGHVVADRRYSHPRRLAYEQFEQLARVDRRGLWATAALKDLHRWRQRWEIAHRGPLAKG